MCNSNKNTILLKLESIIVCLALIVLLLKNHPFIDGNKRIGTHVTLIFLALTTLCCLTKMKN
ncbi:Fic family protein [Gardnerella vaginalis]|uniref:Fic family protein n=1 Tax=Gardnerella vaginalis TaxID=2702 RepID=UPI0018C7F401